MNLTQSSDAHPAPTAALLLLFGHFLGSLVEGEQVLGLLHVQRSLLQELLLFLLLFAPLFFLSRWDDNRTVVMAGQKPKRFVGSRRCGSAVTDLFFHELLTQQIPLLLLLGAELLLLLILLPGSSDVVLSLTQQVRALPAAGQHKPSVCVYTTCRVTTLHTPE